MKDVFPQIKWHINFDFTIRWGLKIILSDENIEKNKKRPLREWGEIASVHNFSLIYIT